MVKCIICENFNEHKSECIHFDKHVNPSVERMCEAFAPSIKILRCPDCGEQTIPYDPLVDKDLKMFKTCPECGSIIQLDYLIPKEKLKALTEEFD